MGFTIEELIMPITVFLVKPTIPRNNFFSNILHLFPTPHLSFHLIYAIKYSNFPLP